MTTSRIQFKSAGAARRRAQSWPNNQQSQDQATLQLIVNRYGITDVLLMLADGWRHDGERREREIRQALIDARNTIVNAREESK